MRQAQFSQTQYQYTVAANKAGNLTKNIIIFGKTGSGKSTICNVVSGSKNYFKESSDLASETKECTSCTNNMFGDPNKLKCQVIDTPGFMDSSGNNMDPILAIDKILGLLSEVGFYIGLFCISAAETRCDKGIIDALKYIKELMSQKTLEQVYIVITQVNRIKTDIQGSAIKKVKEQVPEILKESGVTLNYSTILIYNHEQIGKFKGLEQLESLLANKTAIHAQILIDYQACRVNGNPTKTRNNLMQRNPGYKQCIAQQIRIDKLEEKDEEQKQQMRKLIQQQKDQTQEQINKLRDQLIQQHQLEKEQLKKYYNEEIKKIMANQAQDNLLINEKLKKLEAQQKKGGCFLFGTKFQRENQGNVELVSIENIQVGDRILSINKFGDCFYDEVMIIDENKLAKELEIPMTTITYMDKFTNELISLTVTHHHFIHTYQDNKIVSKLSRDLKIGDIIKIVSQDLTMIYQTEIINLEYGFAMNGVKNIVTRESYSVIANSIHCSVHCEGDGGDLLFNVGYYMHMIFGQKAIQLLYKANKAYKSFRRGITMEQK